MKYSYRRILTAATDIIPKLPHRGDGVLAWVIKLIGIADSCDTYLRGKGKIPSLYEFFSAMNLDSARNYTFIDSFFGTRLCECFEVTRIQVAEVLFIVKATHPKLGTIYFVEWCFGSTPEISSEFWFTKDFDFKGTLQLLWDIFNSRIHLGLRFNDKQWRTQAQYSTIPTPLDPLLGSSIPRLQKLVQQHKLYMQDEVQRTYLFVGTQGVGKTTMALEFAAEWERTLRLDARGLTVVGTRELDFLIDALQPDFLIVDDLDRANELSSVLPTLFGIMTDFKVKHPKVTIILTCNKLDVLEPALIRPGRVDDIVEFEPPETMDRKLILSGYLDKFRVALSQKDMARLVKETEGLTAAYLRELALQTHYQSIAGVVVLAKKMRAISVPKKVDEKTAKVSGTTPEEGQSKAVSPS